MLHCLDNNLAPMESLSATTTVELLDALETARANRGVSKAELARLSRVRAQTVRRLLTDRSQNPTISNILDLLRPLGLGLGLVELPKPEFPSQVDRIYAWLSFYGAPLYGSTKVSPQTLPGFEVVAAEAVKTSRIDATIARALPSLFWKNRERIDWKLLREEAERWGQSNALGFFLDLTAQLSGDMVFNREANKLFHSHSTKRSTQFFQPTTAIERQLAELKTPKVARRWGFRMNMGLDSFASMFEKASR
jgi:transcriptional regulator with XRE-family HTH domain